MKNDNIIQMKSYDFSLKIIKIFQHLSSDKKEFVLRKQLLKSGTSIGANIEEAIGGQSAKDFFAKMTIAYKEARETHYWIRLLIDSNYIEESEGNQLLGEVTEILRIIASIQKSMKNKM